MIQITSRRLGLIVAAATANDFGDVTLAFGLTERGARRRLLRAAS